MDNERFALNLRDLIESRGLSQKWLADKAETTEATISRYLNGLNQPSIYIVTRIAAALDVSMDYLCGITDSTAIKETLGEDAALLIHCFNRSDARDRQAVWIILERYMTEPERIKKSPAITGEGGSQLGFGRTGTRGT